MKSCAPFSMIHLTLDGDTLYMGWLPQGDLIVAIQPDWKEGMAVTLDESQALQLKETLTSREFLAFDALKMNINSANRGEPYRDGMEITLGEWQNGTTAFFVEDIYIEDLIKVVAMRPSLDIEGLDHD